MKRNKAYSGSLHEKKMSAMKKYSIENGNKVKQNSTTSHCRINLKKSNHLKFNHTTYGKLVQ